MTVHIEHNIEHNLSNDTEIYSSSEQANVDGGNLYLQIHDPPRKKWVV